MLIDNGSLINVVRFADITRRSCDLRQLLQSVAAQLSACTCPSAVPKSITAIMNPSSSYDEVLANFRCLIDSFPEDRNLVVFIDGIDRLTDIRLAQVQQQLDGKYPERVQLPVKAKFVFFLKCKQSPVYGSFFDRYFHIPLPIVTKHELCLPFPPWNLPIKNLVQIRPQSF